MRGHRSRQESNDRALADKFYGSGTRLIVTDVRVWARDEEDEPCRLLWNCQDWVLALACDEAAKQKETIQLGTQPWSQV